MEGREMKNEKQVDAAARYTREVYECALAIIRDKEAHGVLPLHATSDEVVERLRRAPTDVAYEFGRIDAYGVATCGRTLNGYYLENKKH